MPGGWVRAVIQVVIQAVIRGWVRFLGGDLIRALTGPLTRTAPDTAGLEIGCGLIDAVAPARSLHCGLPPPGPSPRSRNRSTIRTC